MDESVCFFLSARSNLWFSKLSSVASWVIASETEYQRIKEIGPLDFFLAAFRFYLSRKGLEWLKSLRYVQINATRVPWRPKEAPVPLSWDVVMPFVNYPLDLIELHISIFIARSLWTYICPKQANVCTICTIAANACTFSLVCTDIMFSFCCLVKSYLLYIYRLDLNDAIIVYWCLSLFMRWCTVKNRRMFIGMSHWVNNVNLKHWLLILGIIKRWA